LRRSFGGLGGRRAGTDGRSEKERAPGKGVKPGKRSGKISEGRRCHRLTRCRVGIHLVLMSSASLESLSSERSYYLRLAEALRERIAVIRDHALRDRDPALHLEKLKNASERIQVLKEELPPGASPQLAHFLERASFDKALAFVEELLT